MENTLKGGGAEKRGGETDCQGVGGCLKKRGGCWNPLANYASLDTVLSKYTKVPTTSSLALFTVMLGSI